MDAVKNNRTEVKAEQRRSWVKTAAGAGSASLPETPSAPNICGSHTEEIELLLLEIYFLTV